MDFSQRYEDSDGAFGYYDIFPVDEAAALGLDGTFGYTSGLHNTLVVSIDTVEGVSIDLLFGPHGRRFDANIRIGGTAEFQDLPIGGIELSGDSLTIEVLGEEKSYTAGNLDQLSQDLKDAAGLPEEIGDAVAQAMRDTLHAISVAENVLDQFLDGSTPLPAQQEDVPVAFDEAGTATEWETFETPMMADEFGNFVGSENANHYTYTSGAGSITIYDHSEDVSVRDRLTFEGITTGQVSFARDDHDLVVSIAGGDTVTINNYFLRPAGQAFEVIEDLVFDGEEVMTSIDIDNLFGVDSMITGTDGGDTLAGGTGVDTLTGGLGNDLFVFETGDDDDTITDFVPGEDSIMIDGVTIDPENFPSGVTAQQFGNDLVVSYGTDDTVTLTDMTLAIWIAALSSTPINGTSGRDTLIGTAGDDQIDSLGDNDQLYGGAGNDTLTSASGNNNMYGEAGDDTLVAGTGHDQLTGGTGDDVMTGGTGRNIFHFATGDGSDVITDFKIDDKIYVDGVLIGDSDAFPVGMTGAEGADGYEIHYGTGDVITLTGVSAAEFYDWARINVMGTAGDDTIAGRSNADAINGAGGDDILLGNGGRDTLHGNDGADQLDGGSDHDVLYGDDGDDILTDTGGGNDKLYGGAGNDVIDGGSGHDLIEGGTGDDTLTGAEGRDTFVFVTGDGVDTITDFDPANDTLKIDGTTIADLSALPAGISGATSGNDFELSYGSGDGILILSTAALVAGYPELFGSADDVKIGTAGDDLIDGGRGNDTLTGAGGDDSFTFETGDGEDIITDFTDGDDSLLIDGVTVFDLSNLPTGVAGSVATDGYVLSYGTGDTILIQNTPALALAYPDLFSNPDEVITGTSGRDTLTGGIGDDQIDSLGDNDQLYGGAGNDTLTSASGNNNMYGEAGNDTLLAGTGHDQLTGGTGDDVLTGGSGRNTFHFATGDGSDVISDFKIDDKIYVDGILIGDPDAFPAGMTSVEGATGYEVHYGSGDVITLTGVSAAEFYDWARINVTGTAGDDTIAGRSNADAINGAGGDDILLGNGGRDTLHGNDGADQLDGGSDHDVLYGDAGDDLLTDAGGGNDKLYGGAGNDVIDAGVGHDTIDSGTGDDTLTGAEGRDTFVFATGDGSDTVTDFDAANDKVKLVGTGLGYGDLTIADGANGAEISWATGDLVVLQGVLAAEITETQFLFA